MLVNASWVPQDYRQSAVENIITTCNLRFIEHRNHVGHCQLAELDEPFA